MTGAFSVCFFNEACDDGTFALGLTSVVLPGLGDIVVRGSNYGHAVYPWLLPRS